MTMFTLTLVRTAPLHAACEQPFISLLSPPPFQYQIFIRRQRKIDVGDAVRIFDVGEVSKVRLSIRGKSLK